MHLLEIVYLSKELENRTMFLRLKILQGKTFVYLLIIQSFEEVEESMKVFSYI